MNPIQARLVKYNKAVNELAGELYACYCEAVGGKAYNGGVLPTWEQFAADKAKETQANAWRRVAALKLRATAQDPCNRLEAALADGSEEAVDDYLEISGTESIIEDIEQIKTRAATTAVDRLSI